MRLFPPLSAPWRTGVSTPWHEALGSRRLVAAALLEEIRAMQSVDA